jgi:thiol-disulfide isomerase/thioredoxin
VDRAHRRRGWVRVIAVAALGVTIVAAGWEVLYRDRDGQTTGSTIAATGPVTEYTQPDRGEPVGLAGTTLTDEVLDLADLRGQVVVINVWGLWCVPRREEAPVLARLFVEYADDGVQFVGVNIKDNRAAAVAFERRYGITYPSIEDGDGRALPALSRHVPAQAVPVTLVLDRQGRVAARVIGVVREATLRALLDAALAEDPA